MLEHNALIDLILNDLIMNDSLHSRVVLVRGKYINFGLKLNNFFLHLLVVLVSVIVIFLKLFLFLLPLFLRMFLLFLLLFYLFVLHVDLCDRSQMGGWLFVLYLVLGQLLHDGLHLLLVLFGFLLVQLVKLWLLLLAHFEVFIWSD